MLIRSNVFTKMASIRDLAISIDHRRTHHTHHHTFAYPFFSHLHHSLPFNNSLHYWFIHSIKKMIFTLFWQSIVIESNFFTFRTPFEFGHPLFVFLFLLFLSPVAWFNQTSSLPSLLFPSPIMNSVHPFLPVSFNRWCQLFSAVQVVFQFTSCSLLVTFHLPLPSSHHHFVGDLSNETCIDDWWNKHTSFVYKHQQHET